MLATVPSNIKNPQWLAEQAEEVAHEAGLRIDVRDEKALAPRGSAASSGSARARPRRRG